MDSRVLKKAATAVAVARPEARYADQSLDSSLLHRGDEHLGRFREKPRRLEMISGPAETPSDSMTASMPVSARFTVVISSALPAIFSSVG